MQLKMDEIEVSAI